MCVTKKYFYFQVETSIEVELLFGKLEFFKISGPEGKKRQSFGKGKFFQSWARLFKAGLDKSGLA